MTVLYELAACHVQQNKKWPQELLEVFFFYMVILKGFIHSLNS